MEKALLCILIGLIAGTFGGFLGLGGGTIMIPALIFFLGFSQHAAQGISLASMIPPVTLLAAIEYYHNGYIDVKISLFIALGFVIGGFLGAYMANMVSDQLLKKMFGIYLLALSLKYLFGK